MRRLASAFLIPWFMVIVFCLASTWLSLYYLDWNAIIAPVLKVLALAKGVFIKVIPAAAIAIILTFITTLLSKLTGVLAEAGILLKSMLLALFLPIASSWKAWTVKKTARQTARLIASVTARFVFINVLLSLLFGHERRTIKQAPATLRARITNSKAGKLVLWWHDCSDRQRRLMTGAVICLVLVAAGQKLIGISILVFDLIWELLLWLSRLLTRAWHLLSPILLRLVPNTVSNLFATRILPALTRVVPIVRDDHRVLFLRFNLRRQYRRIKCSILLRSRRKRPRIRKNSKLHR